MILVHYVCVVLKPWLSLCWVSHGWQLSLGLNVAPLKSHYVNSQVRWMSLCLCTTRDSRLWKDAANLLIRSQLWRQSVVTSQSSSTYLKGKVIFQLLSIVCTHYVYSEVQQTHLTGILDSRWWRLEAVSNFHFLNAGVKKLKSFGRRIYG